MKEDINPCLGAITDGHEWQRCITIKLDGPSTNIFRLGLLELIKAHNQQLKEQQNGTSKRQQETEAQSKT